MPVIRLRISVVILINHNSAVQLPVLTCPTCVFGEALLWTKFSGIIERFSRTYITMERYLHIIQCKTIELSIHLKMETVRRSFAVVIAFPQLKCMNVAASKNSSRACA